MLTPQDIVLQHGLLPLVDFPAIFGHEGAGTVLQVGAVAAKKDPALRPGATVLLSFNTCGSCRECTASRPSRCLVHMRANASCVRLRDGSTPARMATGTRVRSQCFGQSSFSRVSVVAARSVVVVPEALLSTPDKHAIDPLAVYAPLGCGFQTGAGTVFNVLKAGPEDSMVIFGMGSVGLAALMAARHCRVRQLLAVDVVEEKLAMARELGATDTLNAQGVADADVVAELRRVSGGSGVTYAIDCTGIVSVIESLVECLAPGGTAVCVGVPAPGKKVHIDALSFLMDSKTFIGALEGESQPEKVGMKEWQENRYANGITLVHTRAD